MTEKKREQAAEALVEVLRNEPYLEEENGVFTNTIYACYDDGLTNMQAETVLKSDDPEFAFYEAVEVYFDYYHGEYKCGLIEKAVRKSYPSGEAEEKDIRDYLRDIIDEMLVFEYPYEHFLNQTFDVDLLISVVDDTGSKFFPTITWLASTQGVTEPLEASDGWENDESDTFIGSIRREVVNVNSFFPTNVLTFLAEMSMRDLLSLSARIRTCKQTECLDTITIKRDAKAGLYDPYFGCGSLLDIKLEKDVLLPVRYIRKCVPDSNLRYPVNTVYGLGGSAWKDVVDVENKEEK